MTISEAQLKSAAEELGIDLVTIKAMVAKATSNNSDTSLKEAFKTAILEYADKAEGPPVAGGATTNAGGADATHSDEEEEKRKKRKKLLENSDREVALKDAVGELDAGDLEDLLDVAKARLKDINTPSEMVQLAGAVAKIGELSVSNKQTLDAILKQLNSTTKESTLPPDSQVTARKNVSSILAAMEVPKDVAADPNFLQTVLKDANGDGSDGGQSSKAPDDVSIDVRLKNIEKLIKEKSTHDGASKEDIYANFTSTSMKKGRGGQAV